MTWVNWALLTLTGVSAVTDLLYGRIYNCIVLPFMAGGLVLSAVPACGGSAALLAERLGSMAIVCALFLPFWMCLPGSIGGGDIKLYLAMAAVLPRNAFLILLFVSLAGAGGMGVLRRLLSHRREASPQGAPTPAVPWRSREGRIRIGPVVFCMALIYAGGWIHG